MKFEVAGKGYPSFNSAWRDSGHYPKYQFYNADILLQRADRRSEASLFQRKTSAPTTWGTLQKLHVSRPDKAGMAPFVKVQTFPLTPALFLRICFSQELLTLRS